MADSEVRRLVELRSGDAVGVRPVERADDDELQKAFMLLSDRSATAASSRGWAGSPPPWCGP